MQILSTSDGVLTNGEVLDHLDQIASKRGNQVAKAGTLKSPNFEAVVKELTEYLNPSLPTSIPTIPPYSSPNYMPDSLKELLRRLKPFNLERSELVMILNLRPQSLEFLDCIIEELDTRLDADQQTEILTIIGEILGNAEAGVMEDVVSRNKSS